MPEGALSPVNMDRWMQLLEMCQELEERFRVVHTENRRHIQEKEAALQALDDMYRENHQLEMDWCIQAANMETLQQAHDKLRRGYATLSGKRKRVSAAPDTCKATWSAPSPFVCLLCDRTFQVRTSSQGVVHESRPGSTASNPIDLTGPGNGATSSSAAKDDATSSQQLPPWSALEELCGESPKSSPASSSGTTVASPSFDGDWSHETTA